MRKIIDIYYRIRIKLLIPFTLTILFISLINLYFLFEITPTSNDECIWEPSVSGKNIIITFRNVKFEGVTWDAGIRDGDILLEIEGKSLINEMHAQAILNSIPEGQYANYKISRNGEIIETKVYVKKLINLFGLGYALLGFFWLIIGYIVVKSKLDGKVQILFYKLGVLFVLCSIFSSLNATNNPLVFKAVVLYQIFLVLWIFGISFLPFTLIHFFWVFPKEFKIVQAKNFIKTFYSIPVIIFIGLTFGVFFGQIFKLNLPIQKIINIVFLWFGLFGFLIGLISLFVNYIRLDNKSEKNSIFLILISYAIGFASIVYFNFVANAIADNIYNSPEYFSPIIILMILPISFGYSIFRYSLLGVSDIIKTTIIYGILTVIIAGTYFGLIYYIGQGISSVFEDDYQGIVTGVIFIIFALVFQSSKDRIQKIIAKKFYPEQFLSHNAILKFSNDLNTIVGLENILDSLKKIFDESSIVNKYSVLLTKDGEELFAEQRANGFAGKLNLNCNLVQLTDFLEERKKIHFNQIIEVADFDKLFLEQSIKLKDYKVYTIIPMIVKSKIIGLMLFGTKANETKLSNKDIDLISVLASQAAVAIENARLYQKEAERTKIERDLENARKIQMSLLPKRVPQFNGVGISADMIPAMHVGGDYYDIIRISEKKFFVVVGDVSGKGLSASFYMTQLQTMMRLFCSDSLTPKEILLNVNRRIFEHIERNWFITISIALFDLENNVIQFCRAGHTPLLVFTESECKYYLPKGIGVGLEKGDVFENVLEQIEIPIMKDSYLLFYSDGISEEMNEQKEMFGDYRLCDLVKENYGCNADQLLNKIIENLKNFRNNKEQHDDITLVVLKTD